MLHHLYIHSDVNISELFAAFPNEQILIPGVVDDPQPPYLVLVRCHDLALTMSDLRDFESKTGKVTTLPHPRSKKPLTDNQIAKLQKHSPKVKKNDTMYELLGYVYADCNSAMFDPELHAV